MLGNREVLTLALSNEKQCGSLYSGEDPRTSVSHHISVSATATSGVQTFRKYFACERTAASGGRNPKAFSNWSAQNRP